MFKFNHHSFLCAAFLALAAPLCNAAATIIFLNGTSSTGKSSIARELQKQLPQTNVPLVSYDDVLGDVLKALAVEVGIKMPADGSIKTLAKLFKSTQVTNEEIGLRIDAQLRTRVDQLAQINDFVILDAATEDETELANRQKILAGKRVLHVLTYCSPLQLMQHVAERNEKSDKDEHRSIFEVFAQLYLMYQPQQPDQLLVDTLDAAATIKILAAVASAAPSSVRREEKANALKLFTQKFKLNEQSTVNISAFFSFDLMVNTGTASPQVCAQSIIKKLSEQSI